ncbi:hypothetical protein AU190_07245 [Mycolicibacterium acapulense]|uniref:Secreted protein n=1 Tax=Mycobacterium lehmannii TaxID=2048550 RepID=A0A101AAY7_9MYCO|nr:MULTISPECIES: hypothetical protein [Mycobacterium]KUI00095.1 hypothetical protein AU189_23320 [Mycolicibacterium acapulense]VEG38229.1 Uncharacterised protein [Mycolicibacterium flavescens]KUI08689.1 hypothetical protein AU190_07245 [Mycolicibacterium acapulense]KUI14323.1 hypothetical protein AU191_21950 [Mycolicibacterium acapulense]KUI19243.1 hypothetical protein AU192_05575 [Mycobacterium lehmannii]
MRLMAAAALACGFVAAPLMTAANAPASPGYCDGADCVPYVDRSAVEGTHCVQNTRYNFGIDASGNTLACNSRSTWVSSPPLVGVRTNRLPCGDATGVAQTPDGIPLSCKQGAWTPDYQVIFYG